MSRICKTEAPKDYTMHRLSSRQYQEKNDCSVIAVALACDVDYATAHAALKKEGRRNGAGTYIQYSLRAIKALGFNIRAWRPDEFRAMINSYPAPHNNLKSVTTHHMRRFPKSWSGCHPNLIMFNNQHMLAVKNGLVMDWSINRALRITNIWEVEKAS